jgi:hypothetical protein
MVRFLLASAAKPLRWRWFWVVVVVMAYPCWCGTAYPRGAMVARIDGARGQRVILAAGYPAPWSDDYAELLQVRYGVEVQRVAGCSISPDVGWYMDGYNGVSRRLLIQRFGKDIFAECNTDAMAKWNGGWQRKGLDTEGP